MTTLVALAATVLPAGARAGSREVRYAPAAVWVAAPPPGTATATPPGSPMRVIYTDQQVRIAADGDETYAAWRIKVLAPEALTLGNVGLTWSPASDEVTVHALRIIRDGVVTDVLAGQKFAVIQREANLERAMLDGSLTATLQAPGLQVGDELEFAMTMKHRDPNLGDVSQGFAQLPTAGALGSYRLRVLEPAARKVRWLATPDMPKPARTVRGGEVEQVYLLKDPDTAVTPDGAPPRYAVRRLLQYTTLPDWAAASRQLHPMFERAATLQPDSPLGKEIARIAAASADPVKRAEAALQLVEERIRYVYVGLDGANYRPATADETWTRRYGDCKAKTALLLALLRGLGVEAEAVVVSASGGDGIDARLPTLAVFDHVLVRARANGRAWWLDGTRLGDRSLANLQPPTFRWALPLRAAGATLEPVPAEPARVPQMVTVFDIDASVGFDTPAKVKAERVVRGDEAQGIRTQLAQLAPADATRAQAQFWRGEADWAESDTTAWRWDEARAALVLSMTGTSKLDWSGSKESGHSWTIVGAGFTPPDTTKRPKDQDQTAPWATDLPRFRCWATTIRLPASGALRWSYKAAPVNRRLAGVEYWRTASLTGNVMRTVMSRRTVVPKISAEEARGVETAQPKFDNNMSQVFETAAGPDAVPKSPASAAVLATAIDWASPDAPCRAPAAP